MRKEWVAGRPEDPAGMRDGMIGGRSFVNGSSFVERVARWVGQRGASTARCVEKERPVARVLKGRGGLWQGCAGWVMISISFLAYLGVRLMHGRDGQT